MKGDRNQQEDANKLGNASSEEISTTQQAVVLPLVFGEVKLAARWLSPVLRQRSEAITQSGGKK